MPELIDKHAAYERIESLICGKCASTEESDCEHCRGRVLMEEVQKIQTIEAEPVRHGRWILKILPIGGGDKIRSYLCSECDRYVNMKFDYCPNCGARMDAADTNVLTKSEPPESEVQEYDET